MLALQMQCMSGLAKEAKNLGARLAKLQESLKTKAQKCRLNIELLT